MKTLIIHNKGQIVMSLSNDSISMEEEYKCLVADIEENKEIVSVDVDTNTVITKYKELTVEEQNEMLVDKVIDLTAENLLLKGDA